MIISVKTNVDEFRAAIGRHFQDQIPFAAARAINDSAEAAQKAITAELPSIFDRPTPFTKRSVKVLQRAGKTDLAAIVGLQPIQAQYLQLEQLGGIRTAAANTRNPAQALLERQQLGPNSYGNIPSGVVPNLRARAAATVAARQANVAARAGAGRGNKRSTLVRGARGAMRKARGIYRGIVYIRGADPQAHGKAGGFFRMIGKKLVPLITFASQAHYTPRFGFHERVGAAALKTFPQAMLKRLGEAIATRK